MASTNRGNAGRTGGRTGGAAASQQDSRLNGAVFHLANRERQRKIKLHTETEKATSKNEAVVLTGSGLPDMRFAEDKAKFSDPRRRVSDGKLDRRFLNNRPDLIEVHRKRGERKNFIFTDDMIPEDAQVINEELAEAEQEEANA